MKRIIVTGSHGFIGSNFIRRIAKQPNTIVYGIDSILEATGSQSFHHETLNLFPNYKFIKEDIRNEKRINDLIALIHPDEIFHFAAETHVCRSNENANDFITTNVLGTNILLQQVRKYCPKCRFVHISTDEVYGSLGEGEQEWEETHPYDPNNPYSVSKAASNMMALAFYRNFGLDVVVTAGSNTYGPNQYPEKLIPKTINHIQHRQHIPIHGSGKYLREWLYVDDHCEAVELLGEYGKAGEIYNIGGFVELENIQVVEKIIQEAAKQFDFPIMSKPVLSKDRPFNDKRYALSNKKITELCGWKPTMGFEEGLEKTVKWYKTHCLRNWTEIEPSQFGCETLGVHGS